VIKSYITSHFNNQIIIKHHMIIIMINIKLLKFQIKLWIIKFIKKLMKILIIKFFLLNNDNKNSKI